MRHFHDLTVVAPLKYGHAHRDECHRHDFHDLSVVAPLKTSISDRVLKLTCTAEDMVPLAVAAAFDKGIHKWNPTERAELMAELDAAYFHLYGLSRDEVEYVMSTFAGASKAEQFDFGDATTADLVLEAYDVLSN